MLRELIDRVQCAEPEDQADILGEAWDGLAKHNVAFRSFAFANARRFVALIDAEGFESAAIMLVPSSCRYLLDKRPGAESRIDGYRAQVWWARYYETADDMPNAWCQTAGLALCAAALKAWDDGR